MISIMT